MKYTPVLAQTDRLTIAYYHMGTPGKPKLMLVHGNASSAVFYLPLMERLKKDFELIAPDLRGFGDTEPKPVDAAQGMKQWADDLYALTSSLGWDHFGLMGWSMGPQRAAHRTGPAGPLLPLWLRRHRRPRGPEAGAAEHRLRCRRGQPAAHPGPGQ